MTLFKTMLMSALVAMPVLAHAQGYDGNGYGRDDGYGYGRRYRGQDSQGDTGRGRDAARSQQQQDYNRALASQQQARDQQVHQQQALQNQQTLAQQQAYNRALLAQQNAYNQAKLAQQRAAAGH